MRQAAWLIAAFVALTTTGAAMADEAVLKELAPTGKLRVGIAVGLTASPLWATKDERTGEPRGVTVDLGRALGAKLGLPVDLVVHASSGEVTEALAAEKIDVGFMPVDEERKKVLAIGPNYALGESTYLVAPGSNIQSIDQVDRPGVRVVGVENTTTIRAVRRLLKQASVTGTKGSTEIPDLVRAGQADAVALGRDSLDDFAKIIPGARVLPGHFWAVGTAIAVPKGRPKALQAITDFIEAAKADGTVKRAFDAAGLKSATVAPADSRS
jgi:polar amino acid transport system substrate-binding protein